MQAVAACYTECVEYDSKDCLLASHMRIYEALVEIPKAFNTAIDFHYDLIERRMPGMRMRQEQDLTKGAIVKSLWLFALPLMLGNVLQQLYNLVDTWVVGRYLGKRALAAVGASYTLMTFLTSVVIGLCLGAGAFFAMAYGRREKEETFRNGIFMSFTAIGGLSIVLTILLYGFVRPLTYLLQVPAETVEDMVTYLIYVFAGFFATFLYNYFASVLRSIGNSCCHLFFLGFPSHLISDLTFYLL